jgi:hypothetical protein
VATFVLPSKLVSERITVEFPFQTEVAILEVLDTWAVEISTVVGEDDEPELLLYDVAWKDGQTIYQQVQLGVPGVIYQVLCTITTDLGNTYEHRAKLAILPDVGVVPDIYAIWYTTELYPIDHLTQFANVISPLSGRLRDQPFPTEYFQAVFAPLSGVLRELLITLVMPEETYTNALDPQSGTLETKLITYSYGPEDFTHALNFVDGTLETKLITYVAREETYTNSLTPISGTLV